MRLITLPQQHPQEIDVLKEALHLPNMWVHVRRPGASFMDMFTYLLQFSTEERARIVLHQQQEMAIEMGINNLHIPTVQRADENYRVEKVKHLRVTTSTHSWAEFNGLSDLFKAAFISPLFPSISKEGYGKEQQINGTAERKNLHTEAIALGGIDATKLTQIKDKGFSDYALCGAIWHSKNPLKELKRCYRIIHLSSL